MATPHDSSPNVPAAASLAMPSRCLSMTQAKVDTLHRVAFIFTSAFMGLVFLVASSDALIIFNYLVSTVTIFVSLTWVRNLSPTHWTDSLMTMQISLLSSSHIAFMRGMRAQGISPDTPPFKAVLPSFHPLIRSRRRWR